MKRILAALLIVLLAPVLVFAQAGVPGTLTQQSPTMLNACGVLASATAAVGTGATATVTVPNAQFTYICGIEITLVCGTTTCTAIAATAITTANLGGLAFTLPSTGMGAAAGTATVAYFMYPNPLKSAAPGTTITVGATPAVANGVWRVNIYGYFAP